MACVIQSSPTVEVKLPIDLESGALRCPRCFGKDVVSSDPRGVMDRIMRQFGRIPRHCRFCGKRFYVGVETIQRPQQPRGGQ